MLTIAMAKGRVMEEAFDLFQQASLPVPKADDLDSRKLVVSVPENELTFFLAKPMDHTAAWPAAMDSVRGREGLPEEELGSCEVGSASEKLAKRSAMALPQGRHLLC